MSKPEGAQSIGRAFQLLKLFTDSHPRWTLAELVEASGLKQTTVFRILASLEHEGVIYRPASGEYQLGSELIALGGRAMRVNRLREVARPHLKALNAQTGESIGLDILWIDENNIATSMAIDEVLGRHLIGTAEYIGARLPAHTTSTGKMLLAHQPDDVLKQLLSQPLQQRTPHTRTSDAELFEHLQQIKQQGFATTLHELEHGMCAVAAPIFGQHHNIKAAVCVSGPTSRIDADQLAQFTTYTIETAKKISHHLGHREGH